MSALLPAVPVLIQLSRIAADAGVEHLEAGRMEAQAGPDRLHGAALILPDGTAFYGSGK